MTMPSSRYAAAIAEIDAANATDPRRELVDGVSRPRELIYSERMSQCLARIYPAASEELQLAARAQHLCRWQIPRGDYPLDRAGYNAWRAAARDHHARLSTAILHRHGYGEPECAHVARIIRKQDLKRDPDSQALENVAAAVFVEHYLEGFIAAHPDPTGDKHADILRKTLRKMDSAGHAAVLALALSPALHQLVQRAMA